MRQGATKIRLVAAVLILVFVASSSGLTREVYAQSVTSSPTIRQQDEGAEVNWIVAISAAAAGGAAAGALTGLPGLPDGVAAGAAWGFARGLVATSVALAIASFAQAACAGGCSGGGDPGGCDLVPRVPENVLDVR